MAKTYDQLAAENADLRGRLDDAQAALDAIRSGQVDALVVATGPRAKKVYTLEGAEHPYRAFVEMMQQGAVTLGSDGTIFFSNPRFAAWMKVPTERLLGTPFPNLICETDRPRLAALMRGVEKGPTHGEVGLRTGDGCVLPVYLHLNALPLSGGIALSVVVTDLTERKEHEALAKAQRLLADSEARLRVTLASIGDAVIVTDIQGRVTFLNPVAESLTGWAQPDAMGRNLADVFTIVNEQSGQPVESPVAKVLREGTVAGLANPAVLIARDGTERPIDDSAAPIRGKEGEIFGCVLVFRDISEKKRAEAEVRQAGEQARSILESITEAFFAVDQHWRFTYVNRQAERLLARKPGDLLKRVIWEVYPGLVGSEFEQVYRRVATERITLSVTSYYADHDRWYEVHVYPAREGISIYFGDVSERKRAEAELARLTQASEQQRRIYETALSNTADFNYVFDLRGRFLYVNKALLALWGKELPEAVGKDFFELDYPPDLAERLQRQIRSVIDTRQPLKDETPYSSAVGERQYEYIFVPVLGAGGAVEAVAGSTRDITERKRAEAQLRESEERFRQLADAMPQIVWTARPDGTIDYQNRQWQEFTGLPETLGKEGWAQLLHPDDAQTAKERWAASVRSGAPFEMEMRLLDRRKQLYRWHLIRTVAVHDESGRVARWFGTATDIHEQKRAEESSRYLAEASAALAGVVDYESTLQKVANLAVPYFADWSAVDVANDDGTLRRLAVAHQDADKVRLAHELMREYPPNSQAPGGIGAVMRTGKPVIVGEITDELIVQRVKDERQLHLIRALGLKSYICVPFIVSGKPLGALTFATAESGRRYSDADLALAKDLAQRAAVAIENTQLYEALRDTDRRKDEFLATLAHELRNPLAPIRNGLQVLKLSAHPGDVVEEARTMMERQVAQMVRLVDDLLDVSRITRNKLELRKEQVELATVVNSAVETSRPLIDAGEHDLTVSLPPTPINLDADLTRLAQVFSNVLNNAAKYTERGGHIWLTAESQGKEVVVTVQDNGIGIRADMLPKVFEMFTQADRALERSHGGLGIGLTLVRRLVEMHGGTVEAQSAGPGHGSTFVVRLPILGEPPGREERQEPSSGRKKAVPKRRILVVDDNEDAAQSLSLLLRLMGNEVGVAHDGVEAVETAKMFHPDVILLDIGLPKLNGYEACRRIREQPGGNAFLIVALTGWGQEEDMRRSNEAGFNQHMVKPVDPADLERLLADLESGAV